ncbi:MAG: extracellular solute-binding protein [Phycisphaerales bacterium]|nr:extracellular solute-binding protein [Phycisphaerales bacterium]
MKLVSRLILAIMLILAAGILILGPKPDENVPPGRIVVDYWEKWSGIEGAQMQQIVDWFNETVGREKNIFVRYLAIAQVDRKTLTATAAGVPPDIAGLWQRDLVSMASRNALTPLDEFAREHGIDQSAYKPVFWKMCSHDGRLYSLVSTPATMALHFNRRAMLQSADQLRAAGVDPFQAPRSIAEFDRWAEALDLRDERGNIRRAGYVPMEPGWYISLTPYWFGGRLWDPARGEFYFTDPRTIQAFEWIQSYPRRLGKAALADFSSAAGGFGTPNSPFIAGTVGGVLQGPWMGNYTFNLRPAMSEWVVPKSIELFLPRAARQFNYEWAVEAFPSVDPVSLPDVTFADADLLMIPQGARHPRQAFEFIAFLQRQDVMERLNSLHCKPSPLSRVSDDFIRRHPNPYIAVHERLARSSNAWPQIASPIQAEIGAELELAVQQVYLLEKTPAQALAELTDRARGKYQRFVERQSLRGRMAPRAVTAVGGQP